MMSIAPNVIWTAHQQCNRSLIVRTAHGTPKEDQTMVSSHNDYNDNLYLDYDDNLDLDDNEHGDDDNLDLDDNDNDDVNNLSKPPACLLCSNICLTRPPLPLIFGNN